MANMTGKVILSNAWVFSLNVYWHPLVRLTGSPRNMCSRSDGETVLFESSKRTREPVLMSLCDWRNSRRLSAIVVRDGVNGKTF